MARIIAWVGLGACFSSTALSAIEQLQQLSEGCIQRLPALGETMAQAVERYNNQALDLLKQVERETFLLRVSVADGFGWYALLGSEGNRSVFLWVFGQVAPAGRLVEMSQDEAVRLFGEET